MSALDYLDDAAQSGQQKKWRRRGWPHSDAASDDIGTTVAHFLATHDSSFLVRAEAWRRLYGRGNSERVFRDFLVAIRSRDHKNGG